MSAERSSKSHAMAWAVTVMVGVPLLYLLSVAPITALFRKSPHIPRNAWTWLNNYCRPASWISRNTALRKPLNAYYDWWCPPHRPELDMSGFTVLPAEPLTIKRSRGR
jgi:hypothetical protein